jgi:two-component system cell cycle response regulator
MPAKILTVDDSKTIRLIIARAFRRFDCLVLEAANGAEALVVAAAEKPDLIILDLNMPVMDGYEALVRLKEDPDLKGIPVVMLTAESGRDNVLRVARQGVRDYLIKPFREDFLVDRIGRIVPLVERTAAPADAVNFAPLPSV